MIIKEITKNILHFSFIEEETEFPLNITALIDDKKILLIDTAYKKFSTQVKDYFLQKGFSEFEIFLTHHHEDHIDGIKNFQDSKIIGSKNFETDFQEHLQTDEILKSLIPDVFIEDLKEYKSQNFNIRFLQIPGHNNCEFAFFINNEILKIGDLIFFNKDGKQSLPYIDIHSFVDDYIESLEKLKKLNASVLVTGHGDFIDNKNKIEEVIDKQIFYLSRIKENSDADLQNCLIGKKENYAGLNFHKNNLQRAKVKKQH